MKAGVSSKRRLLFVVLLAICTPLLAVKIVGVTVSVAALIIAVLCVLVASEVAVEGFGSLFAGLGFTMYVAGVASSLASNLPEAVLAILMTFSPHLRDVAAVMVVLAVAFNTALLGTLVLLVSWKKGYVDVPQTAMTLEAEAMRMGVVVSLLYAAVGLLSETTGRHAILPREAAVFPLLAYGAYIVALQRRESVEAAKVDLKAAVLDTALGMAGIIVGSELIANVAEYWVSQIGLNPVIAATVLAFAASVPEHGIAVIGALRGQIELGLSNVVSGIVQSILFVFPLVALVSVVMLDGFVVFELIASAAVLWLVEKAITDDKRLTADEGVFLLLTALLGILLLDELSLMI